MAAIVFSLSEDEKILAWIDARAQELGLSRSALVRELVFECYDKRPRWDGLFITWGPPAWRKGEQE